MWLVVIPNRKPRPGPARAFTTPYGYAIGQFRTRRIGKAGSRYTVSESRCSLSCTLAVVLTVSSYITTQNIGKSGRVSYLTKDVTEQA